MGEQLNKRTTKKQQTNGGQTTADDENKAIADDHTKQTKSNCHGIPLAFRPLFILHFLSDFLGIPSPPPPSATFCSSPTIGPSASNNIDKWNIV